MYATVDFEIEVTIGKDTTYLDVQMSGDLSGNDLVWDKSWVEDCIPADSKRDEFLKKCNDKMIQEREDSRCGT